MVMEVFVVKLWPVWCHHRSTEQGGSRGGCGYSLWCTRLTCSPPLTRLLDSGIVVIVILPILVDGIKKKYIFKRIFVCKF